MDIAVELFFCICCVSFHDMCFCFCVVFFVRSFFDVQNVKSYLSVNISKFVYQGIDCSGSFHRYRYLLISVKLHKKNEEPMGTYSLL